MSFRSRRVFLSTPFYILFQFFLIKYALLLIWPVNDIHVAVLAILIGLNRFVPMLFEERKSRSLTRFLTTVDGVWMWASLIFLIDVIIIYLIGMFVDLPYWIKVLLLAAVPVLGVYNYYKAHKLIVNERTLILDNLSQDITIAHLSDVHFGSVRHRQIIRQIADKLRQLEGSCDLVIISGDLADGSSVVEEDDFSDFSDVDIPIIFTPGNHDFYPGIDSVVRACRNAGIIVLVNEAMEFRGLNIYGLPFSFDDRGTPGIDRSAINPGLVNVLNYHVPYHWEEFSSLGFDVQLSGHTHGGQFYPAVNFCRLLFEYDKGLYDNGSGKYLHVTTGVGSMDTPMRWGTDSEIVILKLQKKY
jgi:hypothetical protein